MQIANITQLDLDDPDVRVSLHVALLADGTQRLTVFAPTDQAFRLLAKDLTGKTIRSEKKIFEALVDLAGVDTVFRRSQQYSWCGDCSYEI